MGKIAAQIDEQRLEFGYNDHDYHGHYVCVKMQMIDPVELLGKDMTDLYHKIICEDTIEKAKKHKISHCRVFAVLDHSLLYLRTAVEFYFSPEEEFIFRLTV